MFLAHFSNEPLGQLLDHWEPEDVADWYAVAVDSWNMLNSTADGT